jgi:hypothetical protein
MLVSVWVIDIPAKYASGLLKYANHLLLSPNPLLGQLLNSLKATFDKLSRT